MNDLNFSNTNALQLYLTKPIPQQLALPINSSSDSNSSNNETTNSSFLLSNTSNFNEINNNNEIKITNNQNLLQLTSNEQYLPVHIKLLDQNGSLLNENNSNTLASSMLNVIFLTRKIMLIFNLIRFNLNLDMF